MGEPAKIPALLTFSRTQAKLGKFGKKLRALSAGSSVHNSKFEGGGRITKGKIMERVLG